MIAGTALGLLRDGGGLGGLLGGPGYGPRGGHGGSCDVARSIHETGEMRYIIENERRVGCLEAQIAALREDVKKNEKIACLEDELSQVKMLRYVDDKTCGVVKGQNLLNPNQIADPYMGQRMVIATHPPVVEVDRYRREGFGEPNCYDRFY